MKKDKSKKLSYVITAQDKMASDSITQLKKQTKFDNLEEGEIAIYKNMISHE